MIKFSRRHTVYSKIASQEYSESEFIPYYCHWDGNTIVTKKDELLQVIKVEGFSFETADDEEVDLTKHLRNTLLKSISNGSCALWFHLVRKRQTVDVAGEQPSGFAEELDELWREKHKAQQTFRNDLYITVILRPDIKGVAAFEHFLKMVQQKADKKAWEMEIQASHQELSDLTKRIIATLKQYRPKILGLKKTSKGTFSEAMEFLGMLVNGGHQAAMLPPSYDISKYLPTHRLYFGPRAMEIRGPTKSRFAGIVSLKEYPPHTSAGMMDVFLQLPHEFIISQSFGFSNRQSAISDMRLQQRRMESGRDLAQSQTVEISEALDMAMSGKIAFGEHHMTIMCIEDDLRRMEDSLSLVYGELVNIGANPVRETTNLQASYWAQLPGNFDFIARKSTIHSLNVASFASLHNYPVGRREGNHWGDAVTVFDTTSGTPYFFNFHLHDVGHTTIIGPTGAGKTVLMNFLCTQAQKYNARMFFFDKDRGAEIFIRALGGVYTVIDPGQNSNFNPLQLEDTPENRSFLVEWFSSLVTTHEDRLTPQDVESIKEAINGNYKLPKESRNLTNVAPFFGLEGPDKIASRLNMWFRDGSHSKLFDNEIDSIDFSNSRIYGFEMGEILKDKISLGPSLLYLFHRISQSLDGTPTMIILDEAWALIDNPVFAPKIRDWLKTMRKLNAMVIFATQSVEDASKSNISDTLIQQTATQIFLPNLKATEEYKKTFLLTDREFTLIRTTNPTSRYFLVKQGEDTVVARIDLSSMEKMIHVLSGRAETVRVLDKIREEVGDNPDDWLPIFYERVKDVA
jgi:type IV secretion system protein VirB4